MKLVVMCRLGLRWEFVQGDMFWVDLFSIICLIQIQSLEKVLGLLWKVQLEKKLRKELVKDMEERLELGEELREGSWKLEFRYVERGFYLLSEWCLDIREDG